jgi:hypothetical protein
MAWEGGTLSVQLSIVKYLTVAEQNFEFRPGLYFGTFALGDDGEYDPSGRRTRPAMIHRSIGAVSHGILDWAFAILLIIGPSVAGFAGVKATWAYIFGGVLLAMALVTRYPLGIVKIIGLALHGFVELLLIVCLLAAPWFGNFTGGVTSPRFYWTIGVMMLVLWFLTDFRGVRDRVVPTAPVASPPVDDRGAAPKAKAP